MAGSPPFSHDHVHPTVLSGDYKANGGGPGRRLSVILNALPILDPELFVDLVCGKNRIQNKCEQNYPASGRHDREHPDASPGHAAFRLSAFAAASSGPNRAPIWRIERQVARAT